MALGAFFGGLVVVWVICGFAAGAIRQNQGGSFGSGFLWGFLLGFIGLIVVAATMPQQPHAAPALPQTPASLPPKSEDVATRPAGGGAVATARDSKAVRECPHCKEAMRRDASVCPHCRRDSDAWRLWEGRWWTPIPIQPPRWYDELAGTWREASELPPVTSGTLDVVVLGISKPQNVMKIARTIADESRESVSEIIENLKHPPATVVTDVGYATAHGVRDAIVRAGADADVRPHNAVTPTAPPS
jgi:hypothetical protein